MLIAQVDIPQMFTSYAALSEERAFGDYLFQCVCGQEFRLPARKSMCAPMHAFCPYCRKFINYGSSGDDNVWVADTEPVPSTMHLRLNTYKDSVQLIVHGRSLAPLPRGANRYWRSVAYREAFRFDIKARKTLWTQLIGRKKTECELGDPGELIPLVRKSMLRFLYTRSCIADYKSEVTVLLRHLRDVVHKKIEQRVRHKVSSFFCSSGSYAGWLLLPIGNVAYRMLCKDAPNLPSFWKRLGSNHNSELDGFRAVLKDFDADVIRRAKDTVSGLIAAGGLPDVRSVRHALTEDPFCLRRLVFLHRLFSRSDIAMQSFPLFRDPAHGPYYAFPLDDNLMLLKGMYPDLEILRFLQHTSGWYTIHDTIHMLGSLSDTAREDLYRHLPSLRDLHDTLVRIRRREQNPDYAFDNNIAPIRRRLSMQLDHIRFYLPERSKTLYDAGIALHNCVSSYAGRVRDGETHIVLMADECGKLVACIEVKDGEIRQAKLDRNQSVAKDVAINAEVITWAQKIGLQYSDCQDIAPPRANGGVTAATV